MSLTQRAQFVYPAAPPVPPAAPSQPVSPPAARRRRRLRRRLTPADLVPMAGITFLAASFGLLSVVYLTAFARLTAHGTRIQELDRQILVARTETERINGDVIRLTRRDRVEREAARIGLVQLPAAEATTVRTAAPPNEAAPRQVSHTEAQFAAARD